MALQWRAPVLVGLLAGLAAGSADCGRAVCGRSPPAEGEESSLLQATRRQAVGEAPERPLIQKVDPDDWLRECASELYRLNNYSCSSSLCNYSNYDLINKKSGLCTASISGVFRQTRWTEEASVAILGSDLSKTSLEDLRQHLPEERLPGLISFPTSVRDVSRAMRKAQKRGWNVSAKVSGHFYQGHSAGRGTLLLNLRGFPKYSATSIAECTDERAGDGTCRLALKRGKGAVVRVGAGELWDDVYRAVLAWNNESSHARKYDIQGGGAGTVSAIGGWLQGGGLGATQTRRSGLGVDNALQLEMVLPSGEHVKFGPSRWREDPGRLYPQTVAVQGWCNHRVKTAERLWRWGQCARPIPWEKLWRAVRGGGGGTYGVVTAAHYQLLDLHPVRRFLVLRETWNSIFGNCTASPALLQECTGTLAFLYQEFLLNFLYDPASIGVDEAVSNGCETSSKAFMGFAMEGYYTEDYKELDMWCSGDAAAKGYVAAWNGYVQGRTPYSEAWRTKVLPLLLDILIPFAVWGDTNFAGWNVASDAGDPTWPPGAVRDDPRPGIASDVAGTWSALVPRQWILDGRTSDLRWPTNSLVYNLTYYFILQPLHLLGGAVGVAGDGMDAISRPEREAAYQVTFRTDMAGFADQPDPPLAERGIDEAGLRRAFRPYHNDGEVLLGGTEYNHVSADTVGPLRGDLGAPCPADLTAAGRRQRCHSLQESVWGTELLRELEETKALFDPKGMLDCTFCVKNDFWPDGPRALYY